APNIHGTLDDLVLEFLFVGQYFGQDLLIGTPDDLGGQDPGITGPIKGHGGHGDPGGHLEDREDGIPSVNGVAALYRDPDHRQGGHGGHHTGQVSGPSGPGDDHRIATG